MTREEAIDVLKDILEEATSDEDAVCYVTSEDVKAFNMAIESLSAEQKEEELANDIARRMATIIENEQDMRVILKNASAEPTDIISRAEVLDIIAFKRKLANIDGRILLDETVDRIKALPSAELTLQTPQTYGKSINPSNAEVVADLISRADAIEAVRKKLQDWGGYAFEEHREGLYEATDVLKSLPSAEAVKVAYICDGRKCDADCSDCFRTLDIEHAKDFKLIGSVYYQQESADRPSGEWVIRENGNKECSLCGHERQDGWDYFCGYCGANMGSGGLYYADNRLTVEWKLVSEELPQSVGSYIVTCKGEHGFIYVDYDFWTVADEFKYNRAKVIAWIPFPKPYCGAKMGGNK